MVCSLGYPLVIKTDWRSFKWCIDDVKKPLTNGTKGMFKSIVLFMRNWNYHLPAFQGKIKNWILVLFSFFFRELCVYLLILQMMGFFYSLKTIFIFLKTITIWCFVELLNVITYKTFNIFLINIYEMHLFGWSIDQVHYIICIIWTRAIKETKHSWKQCSWNTHLSYLKQYSLKNWAPSHGSLRDKSSSSNIMVIIMILSNIAELSAEARPLTKLFTWVYF